MMFPGDDADLQELKGDGIYKLFENQDKMVKKEQETAARIAKARSLFDGPYNCSQAVAMAFEDIIGMKERDILRAMSGFGYGMGGERSVCGAVSGGIFVLSSVIADPTQRDDTYEQVFQLIQRFKEQNDGHLNCLQLVGENPSPEDFHTTCPVLIEQVVRAVCDHLAAES